MAYGLKASSCDPLTKVSLQESIYYMQYCIKLIKTHANTTRKTNMADNHDNEKSELV